MILVSLYGVDVGRVDGTGQELHQHLPFLQTNKQVGSELYLWFLHPPKDVSLGNNATTKGRQVGS